MPVYPRYQNRRHKHVRSRIQFGEISGDGPTARASVLPLLWRLDLILGPPGLRSCRALYRLCLGLECPCDFLGGEGASVGFRIRDAFGERGTPDGGGMGM